MKQKYELEYFKYSNILIKQAVRKNTTIQKLFYITVLKSKEMTKENNIIIKKTELINYLGLENQKNKYKIIKENLESYMKNSMLTFGDQEQFKSAMLITSVISDLNNYYLKINESLKDVFIEFSKGYTIVLINDILAFSSKFASILYINLLKYKEYCLKGLNYSTEELLQMFEIDKNAYKNNKGYFNRGDFERRVLNVACNEINKSCCIVDLEVTKVKRKNEVLYYNFKFKYVTPSPKPRQNKEEYEIASIKWTNGEY